MSIPGTMTRIMVASLILSHASAAPNFDAGYKLVDSNNAVKSTPELAKDYAMRAQKAAEEAVRAQERYEQAEEELAQIRSLSSSSLLETVSDEDHPNERQLNLRQELSKQNAKMEELQFQADGAQAAVVQAKQDVEASVKSADNFYKMATDAVQLLTKSGNQQFRERDLKWASKETTRLMNAQKAISDATASEDEDVHQYAQDPVLLEVTDALTNTKERLNAALKRQEDLDKTLDEVNRLRNQKKKEVESDLKLTEGQTLSDARSEIAASRMSLMQKKEQLALRQKRVQEHKAAAAPLINESQKKQKKGVSMKAKGMLEGSAQETQKRHEFIRQQNAARKRVMANIQEGIDREIRRQVEIQKKRRQSASLMEEELPLPPSAGDEEY